jgi:hypothetical protein
MPVISPEERDRFNAMTQEIQQAVHQIRKKAPNAGGACDAIDRNLRSVERLFEEIRRRSGPQEQAS